MMGSPIELTALLKRALKRVKSVSEIAPAAGIGRSTDPRSNHSSSSPSPMSSPPAARIAVRDAMLALAFIGDLSMGRPTDHSHRTGSK